MFADFGVAGISGETEYLPSTEKLTRALKVK